MAQRDKVGNTKKIQRWSENYGGEREVTKQVLS